jgi:hypothetical protein
VEPYNQIPTQFNSLVNPPGPDIFDGQSLHAPAAPPDPYGYHGNRKSDGPNRNDRVQDNGPIVHKQQHHHQYQQQQQQQYHQQHHQLQLQEVSIL